MKFFAHSTPNQLITYWEPLFTPFGEVDINNPSSACSGKNADPCPHCENLDPQHGHLNKVAYLTAKFAGNMFPKGPDQDLAKQWGYLAGLWHDLGKFAPKWQEYLISKADPHIADTTGKLDHSSAGAQHAISSHPLLGHLLAYPIAGHHSGLLDGISSHTCQINRLQKKDLPDWSAAPETLTQLPCPKPPPFLNQEASSLSLFTRMLFSCLVDADFLATESFMNPKQQVARNLIPHQILQRIQTLVDERIDSFPTPTTEVNRQRRIVVENCRDAAKLSPGVFSLTVPTGGGKTLSSLSFALNHALKHKLQRIIYVVPFTSIIEQNAEIIRDIVSSLETATFTPLIEHHSSLDPKKETTQSRLATENWDAPIIITTSVQFYESIYSAKTSRSRKLHNIANSVVILDEAQSLPVDYLAPCLTALQELANNYNTSSVLCTATQPAIHYHKEDFNIGLKHCREIITDTSSLFRSLKRVQLKHIGNVSNSSLAHSLLTHSQSLCIVNRRKHAQEIFKLLGENKAHFHLSALMCPEHRSQILEQIRNRLDHNLPTTVISTQLIEAGVDVDFPIVYRALAGLDSIAQAVGRCNRNGRGQTMGTTYIFEPEDQPAETYFRETAQIAKQLLSLHSDLLSQDAIYHYFDLYYYQQNKRWDHKGILEEFRLAPHEPNFPFVFGFQSAAEKFNLIENWQIPVIIPFDKAAKTLIADLRNPSIPLNRNLLRGLQRYTVQIAPHLWQAQKHSFESLREEQFHVLITNQLNYSQDFGLTFDEDHTNSQHLIVSN